MDYSNYQDSIQCGFRLWFIVQLAMVHLTDYNLHIMANGVPQESIWSPMLFKIYVNLMGEIIWRFELHQYVDDTQLFLTFVICSRRASHDMLYVGLRLEATQKLQLLQIAAALMQRGASRFENIAPILQELH